MINFISKAGKAKYNTISLVCYTDRKNKTNDSKPKMLGLF